MYILVATLTKQETVMKKKVFTALAYIAAGILICIIGRKAMSITSNFVLTRINHEVDSILPLKNSFY